jgi:hypothetical protein
MTKIVGYFLRQGGRTMHHWPKRLFALAAPLLLAGCLWGPGKFTSDLTLLKNGSFILDYKGEIVLQTPPDGDKTAPWKDSMARCFVDGRTRVEELIMPLGGPGAETADRAPEEGERACTHSELAKMKAQYEQDASTKVAAKRKESDEMAKAFGLPGFDDESNRAFAAKLMKFEGWRSVQYRGKGVFLVDYHFEGSAKQDFVFPVLPDNDLLIPFVAIRRRADGSVLVTAPAMTGGSGPIGARAGATAAANMGKGGPVSRAQGRFTVITNGEILTNNSEDGAAPHPRGRAVHWDVSPSSTKIPETLIRL